MHGTTVNELKIFVTGVLEENAYLLYNTARHTAVIIDPGDDADAVIRFLESKKLSLQSMLITHGHWDHTGAIPGLQKHSKAPVFIHRDDAGQLKPDGFLEHGQDHDINGALYTVIHTPGHSPGGICLYGEGRLFSGDTLFLEGIGRSDLGGGDGRTLIRMIKERLFTLPDETVVYPGHGPQTTIGWEKEHNPFD
ncbi:MAG: MBL fold metallo-hydrolase [Elusimicrobia bacterium]|nr:MBL fold metallo-hydrolase [Elusimicrobiota bacterium]MBD3412574.1 MBL fold metallo-hydrolase [Elusimicrobiota bacterium]